MLSVRMADQSSLQHRRLDSNGSAAAAGSTALATMYEGIIQANVRSRPSSLCSSPVRFVDESSDSSPSHSHDSHGRPKGRLVSRLSADNLLLSPASSSPEIGYRRNHSPKPRHRRSISQDGPQGPEEEPGLDSLLAKQSLLAAQVLHLIPAGQARERNFLHGRVAANSMLGAQELDRVLPGRTLRIFVGTWNMNGQPPPFELNDLLLPGPVDHVPDVIAVGTQESHPDKFEWEVKMQETIGPSHVLLHSTSLGTLHLAVFLRRDLLWFCSVCEDDDISVRPGTAFRTKGAIAIGFLLFGTSFLFISAHLTAHQDKVKERVHDIKRIVRSLELPKNLPSRSRPTNKDVTQNFDYVFWCGDLNFRLTQAREDVIQWAEQSPLQVDLNTDQLTQLITEGTCLSEFGEGNIKFPPTYKFDPGTQNYDTSNKQRTPSYTDRILYKGNAGTIECLAYESVPSICTSDHKPVWGVYVAPIRPGKDTIPLAAGLFNREVYLEGIKRRVDEMQRRDLGLSAVCSIQ